MRRFRKSNFLKILAFLFFLILLFVGLRAIVKTGSSQKVIVEQKASATKATARVGKSFKFPAARVGKKGEEEVTFTIVSAELKDEIKVKGTPSRAESGKLFLVLRFEIENNTSERLSLTSSDFIRLLREEEKKFAPDFHNATIIVDPLSIRKDLVSFIILQNERNFTFSVGELEGEKETVEIKF